VSNDSGNGRIVVGFDGSPHSEAALAWAVDEARLRGRGLHVIHAFAAVQSIMGHSDPEYFARSQNEAKTELEQSLAKGPALDGLDVEKSVEQGNPSAVLVEASRGANLLVVGHRGRGSFPGIVLGSVAWHCVHQAHCPVVVIRGEN
jgi:nucleotide-binding universal stress UspA family protein